MTLSVFNTIGASLLLLLLGDFISTFLYHVPEHVFGKFHSVVHHGKNRNFLHYAVLSRNPLVLLDGFLGALPYFIFIPWLWQLSPVGTIIGLALGEFHVVWRHVTATGHITPQWIQTFCDACYITTPERHWQHHKNANIAFGDIFNFYDAPARRWLHWLRHIKRRYRRLAMN
ncbi:sterol desaturase [filamentous cyanobacterium LEGE 11480]|uniref:Sterol desaturase n=1 Tax=Romeriopsis navalis LEGE 11480 TaxID=2777977 RepID=A0A928VNG3_9CYAN|nr:sterol desaturase [Romeriopsis navalis LEGE 11480]